MNIGTRLTKSGAFRHINTLVEVVADFKSRYDFSSTGGHHDPVVSFAKEAPDLKTAIERAVAGMKPDGKMFSKGSCVRAESRRQLTKSLLARIDLLKDATTFDEVYDQIPEVWGIGDMTRFNVAERIGAYLNIYPERFLYLHAGPRQGWQALVGKVESRFRIPREELPPELRAISLHDVEDLLCEYRDLLHPGMIVMGHKTESKSPPSGPEERSPPPTEVRLRLRSAGYDPLPCVGKRPTIDEWQTKIGISTAEIEAWGHAPNTGIICRRTSAIDIDILDEEAAKAIEALARDWFGKSGTILTRIGLPPKRLIPLRTEEAFTKIIASFSAGHKIEVLADGQQFIAFGIHPDTGNPYTWCGGSPLEVSRAELPEARAADLRDFLAKASTLLYEEHGYVSTSSISGGGRASRRRQSDAAPPAPEPELDLTDEELEEDVGSGISTNPADFLTTEEVWHALDVIDPDVGREIWFSIGCALYWAFDDDVGFTIWNEWSAKGKKYREVEMEDQWASIVRKRGYNFTVLTIFFHAREADENWQPLEFADTLPLDDDSIKDAPPPPLPPPKPKPEKQQLPEGVTLDDFVANLADHDYIFIPTREAWPGVSVNTQVKPIEHPDIEGEMKPSAWLDRYRPIHQAIWAPGQTMLIKDRLVADGGWIEKVGVTAFNVYRPPTIKHGDPNQVALWLDHLKEIYPEDWQHILCWLAHRVQRPQEKINHGLVLGGAPGIGKDTMLEPVRHGVGPWNFREVSPANLFGAFNEFIQSVILRVSEARDLGEVDRFKLYDHMKTLMAAPPDVLRVNNKYVRAQATFNVTGVVITTNYRSEAIYLPADDRRHYVAWSELTKGDFKDGYWNALWKWYAAGGIANVVAYLATYNLSNFDPKAPPKKTEAFWAIVNASRPSENADLADVLDEISRRGFLETEEGKKFKRKRDAAEVAKEKVPPWPELAWPDAVALIQIECEAKGDFKTWLQDRRNLRQIPHRMAACDYVPVRNPTAKDGFWVINERRRVIYAKKQLSLRDQLEAVKKVIGDKKVQDLKPGVHIL